MERQKTQIYLIWIAIEKLLMKGACTRSFDSFLIQMREVFD